MMTITKTTVIMRDHGTLYTSIYYCKVCIYDFMIQPSGASLLSTSSIMSHPHPADQEKRSTLGSGWSGMDQGAYIAYFTSDQRPPRDRLTEAEARIAWTRELNDKDTCKESCLRKQQNNKV